MRKFIAISLALFCIALPLAARAMSPPAYTEAERAQDEAQVIALGAQTLDAELAELRSRETPMAPTPANPIKEVKTSVTYEGRMQPPATFWYDDGDFSGTLTLSRVHESTINGRLYTVAVYAGEVRWKHWQ